MLALLHEESGLKGVAALSGSDLGMLGQHLVQLTHGGVMTVVDLAGSAEGSVIKLAAQLLQLSHHTLITGAGKGNAESGLTVLRIGHGDERNILHGILPVLTQGLEGVAQGGDDDGAGTFIHADHAQLQNGLCNGAEEGRAILLGAVQLHIAAPSAHGDEAHGVDDLLGGVNGGAQHHLLALSKIGVHLCLRIQSYLVELLKNLSIRHGYIAPFAALLASMISTRPCTRVSYCASEKLRGSA